MYILYTLNKFWEYEYIIKNEYNRVCILIWFGLWSDVGETS